MKNSVFTLNEKLLGNATTAYKTIPMATINEAVSALTTEMTELDPTFEGINPVELSKKETIEWYQKTAAEYKVLVEKANTPEEKPVEETKVVKIKISKKSEKASEKKAVAPAKKEKKEKVELKKTHAEDGAARHTKYSKELSERQVELETLKSAKEPDKEAIKKVTKRIASLGRKLKRAQIAMGQSIAPSTTPSEEK